MYKVSLRSLWLMAKYVESSSGFSPDDPVLVRGSIGIVRFRCIHQVSRKQESCLKFWHASQIWVTKKCIWQVFLRHLGYRFSSIQLCTGSYRNFSSVIDTSSLLSLRSTGQPIVFASRASGSHQVMRTIFRFFIHFNFPPSRLFFVFSIFCFPSWTTFGAIVFMT